MGATPPGTAEIVTATTVSMTAIPTSALEIAVALQIVLPAERTRAGSTVSSEKVRPTDAAARMEG
jgi:hypothetical protein